MKDATYERAKELKGRITDIDKVLYEIEVNHAPIIIASRFKEFDVPSDEDRVLDLLKTLRAEYEAEFERLDDDNAVE